MFYREAGQYASSYAQDRQLLPLRQDKLGMLILMVIGFVATPLWASDYWISAIMIPW